MEKKAKTENVTVGVVMTLAEREELRAAGKSASMGLSTYIRVKALEAARQ